jgi:serine/threonine-protein kinase
MARPVPSDLEDALAANPAARERFWSMPAERKDQWVRWIERARLPRARRRRIAETIRRFSAPAAPAAAVENERVDAVPLPRDDWGAWFVGLALLAGLAAFLVWYTVYRDDNRKGRSTVVVTAKATVPKVVGIRYQSAVFQLKEAKLTSKLVRRAATKPRGIVIGQKPRAGATVPQGTPVTLVVSNGPLDVKMPDVVGLGTADAVKVLQARKLTVTLDQVASQEAPGTVVGQEPKAGKRTKPGTQVVLQVAKGVAPVSVPDVTGQLEQQATAALKQAGLAARVVRVPSSQPKGTVVAQSPAAG